ncbi:MAG: nucleoside hydrolase [Alphaproteobacteria bacterium]|jgi:purine nucleosidase|nr:nucleoside hydrolase [Alphaproteobacteria bacterium]
MPPIAPRPLIIDCDPGQDDAVALLLAMASPEEFNLLGVTAVAGNVPLNLTEANARRIGELAGRLDVPVYAGCPRPMVNEPVTAEFIHGETGINGADLPAPIRAIEPRHAVEWLIATLRQADEPITLATLGPVTNIGTALVMAPDIADNIREIVSMGGASDLGNVTAAAEFNYYVDPHAAHVMFSAGIKLTMIGLNLTHQALATPQRINTIRDVDTPAARSVVGMLEFYSAQNISNYEHVGAPLHDPCVIAYLMRPEMFEVQDMRVDIEISSPLTMGRSVCDIHGRSGLSPNATVVTKIDSDQFFDLIAARLARLPMKMD